MLLFKDNLNECWKINVTRVGSMMSAADQEYEGFKVFLYKNYMLSIP
jgi:hypothetical protein